MKTFPHRRARMTLITKEDIEYFTNRHSFIHWKSPQIRAQHFSFSSIYVQFFLASLVVLTANKVGFPEPIFPRGLKCVYREMRIDILYLYRNTQLWWPLGITMILTGVGGEETIPLQFWVSSYLFYEDLWAGRVAREWGDRGEFSNLLGGFRLKRWSHYSWFMTESNFWNCLPVSL